MTAECLCLGEGSWSEWVLVGTVEIKCQDSVSALKQISDKVFDLV